MHRWLLKHCDKVVASPSKRDTIKVRDPADSTKWIEQRKYFYHFSIRELWLEMKKPVDQGGWVHATRSNGKFISQSFVAANLPRNLSRMTNSQKEMCGCTVCIDAKGYMMALNGWRRQYMNHLQKKYMKARADRADPTVVRELKDHLAQYKYCAFIAPDPGTPPEAAIDKPIWDSIKVPMALLTCAGPQDGIFENSGLCHLACALQRCDGCAKELPPFPGESTTDLGLPCD